MDELQLMEKLLNEIDGVKCISTSIAPGCGYRYFEFFATESSLKWLIGKFKSMVTVNVRDNQLVYRVGFSIVNFKHILKEMLKEFCYDESMLGY